MPTTRFQPSFAGGVIAPGLHARIDQGKFDIGLKVGKNVMVHAYGGVSNRPGFEFIGEVMDHAVVHKLIPFERDDNENYVLVMGDQEMKIIQDGAYIETSPSVDYNPSTPFTEAMLPDLDYTQSVDVMYFAHPSLKPRKMLRTAATTYTFSEINTNPSVETEDWLDVSTLPTPTNFSVTAQGKPTPRKEYNWATYTYVITAEYGGGESQPTLQVSVSNLRDGLNTTSKNVLTWDAMASVVQYHVYRKQGSQFLRLATILAGTETYTDDGSDSLSSTEPATPELTVTAASAGSETYRYVIAPVIDGVEGFPTPPVEVASAQDLSVSGAANTISWSSTSYVDAVNVYRERNGIYGYIGFTEDSSFIDDNISPDLTTTPVEETNVFNGVDDYPSHVVLWQQRLVFGGSNNEPETVWMSRVGDYENFSRSRILKDDDRVKTSFAGTSINRIRGLAHLRDLVVFTSNAEFTITGPDGVMLATNPIQTQQGYTGSNGVRPMVIEDTMLFVDRTGRQVRDLRYAFEQDGYSGNDLTIWAEHYFRGKEITDWAYQRNPHSIVWVVLDDGTLLSFTYKREHQVWAWTEHEIDGSVESVAVIKEGSEDVLYAIIARTIGGATKRYVERMHSREFTAAEDFFGVDSGITYSGVAATTITGLSHLEGETVVALADGAVVTGLTVSSGQVTLPVAAEKAHVGLPYTAEIETLPPAIDLQFTGSSRGRPIKASQVFIQLEKTRGIEIAAAGRTYAALVQPTGDLSVPGEVITGMERLTLHPEWNTDGTIVVRQTNPLPMTVLGIAPDYSVGRSTRVPE